MSNSFYYRFRKLCENGIYVLGGEPIFSGGLWKCGICQNVTESQLIYSETNEVDTNIDYEDFLQVQVRFCSIVMEL